MFNNFSTNNTIDYREVICKNCIKANLCPKDKIVISKYGKTKDIRCVQYEPKI